LDAASSSRLGALVDRLDRRRLMATVDLVRCLLLAG
jgi:hypothetical protein